MWAIFGYYQSVNLNRKANWEIGVAVATLKEAEEMAKNWQETFPWYIIHITRLRRTSQ